MASNSRSVSISEASSPLGLKRSVYPGLASPGPPQTYLRLLAKTSFHVIQSGKYNHMVLLQVVITYTDKNKTIPLKKLQAKMKIKKRQSHKYIRLEL